MKNRMYLILDVDNLSQKINGKLGGINSVVNTKLALSHSSKEDIFMFFGADVSVNIDIIRVENDANFIFR